MGDANHFQGDRRDSHAKPGNFRRCRLYQADLADPTGLGSERREI
jgi:hypothetical protein